MANLDNDFKLLKTGDFERFSKTDNDPKVITEQDIFRIAAKLTHKRYHSIASKSRMAADTFDKEDLFQEAVMNLLKKKGSFDPSKSSKSTYLYTWTNMFFMNKISSNNMPRRQGDKLSLDYEIDSGNGYDGHDVMTLQDFIPDANPTPAETLAANDLKDVMAKALDTAILRKIKEKDTQEIVRKYIRHFADNGYKPDSEGIKTESISMDFVQRTGTTRQNFSDKVKQVYGEMRKILELRGVSA